MLVVGAKRLALARMRAADRKQRATSRSQTRPSSSQDFPIGIATVVALPHAAFLGDDTNRRNAANGAKTRRPDLDVNPIAQRYRVARDAGVPAAEALDQRSKTGNICENSLTTPRQDLDNVTRTILAEVGQNGTPSSQAAIASVIRNRLAAGGYGKTPTEVVHQPYQFTPWNAGHEGAPNDPRGYQADSPA